jgi:hypothetical protein
LNKSIHPQQNEPICLVQASILMVGTSIIKTCHHRSDALFFRLGQINWT